MGKVDFSDAIFTPECLEDAKKVCEQESERYNREGYRVMFKAWQWREWEVKIPNDIPDNLMVSIAEHGPMIIEGGKTYDEWKKDRDAGASEEG